MVSVSVSVPVITAGVAVAFVSRVAVVFVSRVAVVFVSRLDDHAGEHREPVMGSGGGVGSDGGESTRL